MRALLQTKPAKTVLVLVSLLLLTGLDALAQLRVTGNVTSDSGEELAGATVVELGTNNAVLTDQNGHYTIQVRSGATLEYSFMGFETQNVKVSKAGKIDIVLEEDRQMLDEIVVVGYGTMRRSDLTGAVASINEDAIKQGVNTSIEQALQGRLAGVQVTQNSGAPGGGISVQIRGINSLNGNEPLYVIDGIAVSGQTSDDSSVLSSINPSDIVSVEVLKDASATAIYGSRASNGVILITTRQGEEGKPKITYEGYAGWQQLPKRVEMMNLPEYADYYNTRAALQGWGIREDFLDPSLLTNGTDWQGEMFRTAFMHNHQLGLTGGTKTAKYALSGGYTDQDGIGLGSNFNRVSFRANINTEINSWLSVGVNASYSNRRQVTTMTDNNLIQTALNQRPDVPARNSDGTFGFMPEDDTGSYHPNPLFEATMRENYTETAQFYYNAFAVIKPFKGFQFRVEYGGNNSRGNSYYFQPNFKYGNHVVESESRRGSNRSDSWSLKTYATYDFRLGRNNKFQIMAGHEAQAGLWENLEGGRKGYISNAVHSLDVGDSSTATNRNSSNRWAIESYYGRFNYNFADRYLLTATVRADGSSRLGPNNRWGTFPSVAAAWRINNEPFMKNINWLNNLKLRLGWGIVGNQNAGNYAYGTTMKNTTTYWGTGYYPGNFSNPDLKWEETKAYNAGLDIAVLENRIEFIFDAYYKETSNLLMTASLPAYIIDSEGFGMSAPWVNAGGMVNRGLEFTLNTVNITRRDFEWTTGVTLSFNRNRITQLTSDDSSIYGKVSDDVYTRSVIGEPVGMFFGYNVIGMFTEEADFYKKDSNGEFLLDEDGFRIPVARPANDDGEIYPIAENSIWLGDYIFEDVNGDGIINEKDRKFIGNPNPDFTFGLNNSIRWKNFSLTFFFTGSYGNDVYNLMRASHTDTRGYSGKMKEVANFARVELIDPEGGRTLDNMHVTNAATAQVQRVYRAGSNNNDNNRISTRFVEDGSYIRLKNLTLSYSLPKAWMQKAGIGGASVYVNAQNLFTLSKYLGYDPEIGSYKQNVLLQGIDNGRYPSQRIYTIGAKINF